MPRSDELAPITDSAQLADLCARLREGPYVTVDTEFMRERTYYPQLCLIQAANRDEAALIDPLAKGLSLEPFLDLLSDADTLKVFHAARQDIEIFFEETGRVPAPLFDTQIAAMVCGFGDSTGYQTLVLKYADKKLDKSARFTDWARRPLSQRQLTYALDDVTYLREVYEGIRSELEKNGRVGWLEEEMAMLTAPETYRVDPDKMWRRVKIRARDRVVLGRLKAAAAWREKLAQQLDVPRNRIVRDDTLANLALHPPKTADSLADVRGVSRKFAEGKHGANLMRALKEAPALEKSELPDKRPRTFNGQGGAVADMLKILLKMRCKEAGVAPKLVASAGDIERLATEEEADVRALKGWRYDLFGQDALKVKRGELALQARDRGIALIRP